MSTTRSFFIGSFLIGSGTASRSATNFYGINPTTKTEIEPPFYSATASDIDAAVRLASDAFFAFSGTTGKARGAFLRKVAAGLTAQGAAIVERANLETGLPVARLQGELARTTNQLALFAEVIEEGSWVDARIDDANPERKPLPKPDVRSMSRALGRWLSLEQATFRWRSLLQEEIQSLRWRQVVLWWLKAHPAHPGTSELVGRCYTAGGQRERLAGRRVLVAVRCWYRSRNFVGNASGDQGGWLYGVTAGREGAHASGVGA